MRLRWVACLLLLASGLSAQMQLPPGTSSSLPEAERAETSEAAALRNAEDAIAAGHFGDAIALLKPLATATQTNERIFYDLGFSLEGSGADTEAETAYRGAIRRDANDAAARVSLGLMLARDGHVSNAEPELLAAVQMASAPAELKARAYRALAQIHLRSVPAKAREELVTALKLTAESPDDVLLAAEIADALGDSAAEKEFRRAVALMPENSDAAVTFARVLADNGKADEARAVLLRVLTLHPGNAAAQAELASRLLQSGHPAEAVPLLEKLYGAEPDNVAVGRLLARAYLSTDALERAERLYGELAVKEPANGGLAAEWAECLLRDHQPGKAVKVLEAVLAKDGAFATREKAAEAQTELAFAATAADDPRMALRALAARDAVLPEVPATVFLSATSHDTLHNTKQAAVQYRRFLELAGGKFPDQEKQARERLRFLDHAK